MELIKLVLSEQALTDGRPGTEYKTAGYVRIASSLVESKKNSGDIKKDDKGKFWFKANVTQQPQTVDLSQYVGSYQEGKVTGNVTISDNALRVNYKNLDTLLDNKGNDSFEFEFGSKGTVKFTKDAQGKVNGFDYKWALMSGHANKVNTTSTTPSNTGSTTNNTTTTTTDAPIPQNITYTKYNDNPSERANTKGFRWKKCDETFPIKYGCANNLIKDLNTCIFGENSSNVYGPALLNSLNDRARDTPNKEISKETYDALIAQCEAKNESINKKRIIKETVKNILKESLLNN